MAPITSPTLDEVRGWSNAQVVAFLEQAGLSSIRDKVIESECTGEDLVSLTPSEIKADLGITKLQAKKLKRALEGGQPDDADALADDAKQHLSVNSAAPPKVNTSATTDYTTHSALQSSSSMRRRAGAPATPPPQPVVVDAQLVETWTQTCALIRQLEAEQVSTTLPAAQERLAYLKSKQAEEHKKFNELKQVNDKLAKKYEELEDGDWYPGKYLMGKHKRDAKVEEAEDKACEAKRKLEAAGKVLEDLASKVYEQEKTVYELSGKVAKLIEAKKWEAQALATAFTGMAGDERENQIEGEVAALVPQVEQLRRYKVSYGKAYEHVRASRKQFEGALQLFQSAFGLANFDVMQDFLRPRPFDNSLGGVMADMAKRAQTQQAQQLTQQAIMSLERACAIIPDMPRINLKDVQGLREMGIFGDVIFDNIVSDMRARRAIQESMQKIQAMIQDVTYVERWLQGWLSGRIDRDLAGLEQAYAAKKQELDECRRTLLQQQANARAATAAAMGTTAVAAAPVVVQGRPADAPSLI